MKKVTIRRIIGSLFLILILGGIIFAKMQDAETSGNTIWRSTGGEVRVHFIDVGQADCILLQADGENMLIDAGNNEDAEKITAYLHSQGVKTLKYVIGTHGHEDHIGGLDRVIKEFQIGTLFLPRPAYETVSYGDVLKAVKEKQLLPKVPKYKEKRNLGNANFLFITPDGEGDYEELNDSSIGIRFINGKHSFLLCGDISYHMESQLLKSRVYLHCDVLKVSHHGSSDTSSFGFLKKAAPRYAVISCGKDNDFGHPHQRTLEKIKKLEIQLFRTDEQGTIIFRSDGNRLTCNVNPIS